jgi:hypothetical protein
MLVRSRYDFEAAAAAVGLRIVAVKASSFFSNDPMGLEGLDSGTRSHFNTVKVGMNQIMGLCVNDQAKAFFVKFLSDIETAALSFCHDRISDLELPSQKLVVLSAT